MPFRSIKDLIAPLKHWFQKFGRVDLAKKTSSEIEKLATVPFVSRYALSVYSGIDTKKIRGLLALHVVKEHGHLQVIAYWKSKDHFEMSGKSLCDTLGVTTTGMGLLQEVLITPTKFSEWLKQNWYSALATIIAIFGMAQVARDDYSSFVGKPRMAFAEPKETKNFNVNEPILINRKIVNTGDCKARIEIRKRSVVDNEGREVTDAEILIPGMGELEPNKSDDFKIQVTGLQPGFFTITHRARLKSFWFGKSCWNPPGQRIRVWRDAAINLEKKPSGKPTTTECYFSGHVFVGRQFPNGITCEAWLSGRPGITFKSVQMRDSLVTTKPEFPLPPAGKPSDTVTKVIWVVNSTNKFTEEPVTLGLVSQTEISDADWLQIINAVEASAQ
jgi:hypothetical protein